MIKKPSGKMSNAIRLSLFWAILIFTTLAVWAIASPNTELKTVPITDVINRANEGKITKIEIQGDEVRVTPQGQTEATEKSTKESGSNLYEQGLKEGKTQIEVKPLSDNSTFWNIATIIVPVLLIAGFFIFMMRQAQGQNNQAMGFGKSKAKLYGLDKERVTFADIAGNDSAKQDLEEVVDFLKHPKKYETLGAKIPKGVLLIGNPGTGKTMLARAVAGEANVPFFSISGSEFVEMFVGVGASRVRDLFSKAKKNAPAIIFIDEIDAVGRHRGAGLGGGHDEREQTLNQILVEMDGFETETSVIVIAATNRPDVLDPALLRPGRFDRRVTMDLPDINEREQILKIHMQGKPIEESVNVRRLAERTPGFSGADLANLVNEAAILATRRNQKTVGMDELAISIEKVILGPERKSKVMNAKEKEIVAYHEGGHALVAATLPNADPVHKVSIISRGHAGGYTLAVPNEDTYLHSEQYFLDELATLLGGYASEKLIFGDVTTGPSNDLERATHMARGMVTRYGMSSLGARTFGHKDELVFLGKELHEERNYSEETAERIDQEVTRIINNAFERATKILIDRRTVLETIARTLLEKETIEKDDFEIMVGITTKPSSTEKE